MESSQIKSAFDAIGDNPESENITFLRIDLEQGEQIEVIFAGLENEVTLSDAYKPTDALVFYDRNGMKYYAADTVLKGMFTEGRFGLNRVYRITGMGSKVSKKTDKPYALFHVAELRKATPTTPTPLPDSEM